MAEDRLITVAIHTLPHALALKTLLEDEGVTVALQNVNLDNPVVSPGVRVRIHECDLPKALLIIENRDIFLATGDGTVPPAKDGIILVPVDFTPHSLNAIDIAFNIAWRHGLRIVLLNAYIDPETSPLHRGLTAARDYDVADAEMHRSVGDEANRIMRAVVKRLRERIKSSQLPAVKFISEVVEGIPEETVLNYAKTHHTRLIVMGTRLSEKKERELVGSVTAEVLDSCRCPILAIPESVTLIHTDAVKRILMICNLDQDDMLAFDSLARIFDPLNSDIVDAGQEGTGSRQSIEVTLVSLPDKHGRLLRSRCSVEQLADYCRINYPAYTYTTAKVSPDNIAADFEALCTSCAIDLIAIPDKKKNMFARLFNPSQAHRLLFLSDRPLIALPI